MEWAVGVDEDFWFPISDKKQLDFLIYNKRFYDQGLNQLKKITNLFDLRKLKYIIMSYGEYTQAEYRAALQACKAIIYLGETESQGLSLFEAWSSNVPTLVRDCPTWECDGHSYGASAAPYLTDECGMFFDPEEFQVALDIFLQALPAYRPRDFIMKNFTLEKSARKYIDIFFNL